MKIYKITNKSNKEEIYFTKENTLNDHLIKAISKLTNKEIGYVQYSINKDNILIVYIKVNTAFTNQGIGTQLIEEIMKEENITYQQLNWDTITQYGQLLKNKLDQKYGPAPFKSYKSIKSINTANTKIYRIAQSLTQYELKQLIIPLEKQYTDFLTKQRKSELTPQEKQEMAKIGYEYNKLSKQLKQNIEDKSNLTKELISQGEEYKVTPENFLKYHQTGFIPSHTYQKYEAKGGLNWLGNISKYPLLIKSKQYGNDLNEIIEFRKSNEKNKYTATNENDEILRDNQGNALTMSDEEAKNKGLPLYSTSIIAFNQAKEPIGLVSNEFGADGVWVTQDYQQKGIGTDLLYEFRKQFQPKRKIGQMTNKGYQMTRKYHKKLVEEALKQGKFVPQDILKEYGLI